MIRYQETVVSPRPPEDVFAYVSDFTTVVEWDPGIASSERSSGEGGVGTTYDVVATFRGREVPMTYEVVEYREPSQIVLRGTGSSVEALDTIDFSADGAGTRLVYTAEFRMKGLLRFAEPFMRGMFDSLGKKAIGGLRSALGG
jgi:carbon monoxide dehydrogenase subunit G